jgi:hypothetical protein
MKINLALALSLLLSVAWFAPTNSAFGQASGTPEYVQKVKATLASIADQQDKSPSAHWLPTGKRDLKTAYRSSPNTDKAQFAMDLQSFVNKAGERLDDLEHTYVSYEKRKSFAVAWWAKNSTKYPSISPPEREKWIDEAIVDATQLRWEGTKKLNESYSASQVMAHDGLMVQLLKKQDKF